MRSLVLTLREKNHASDGGGILCFAVNALVLGGLPDLCRSF